MFKPTPIPRSHSSVCVAALTLVAIGSARLPTGEARASPNMHPNIAQTWDPTASSIAVGGSMGFFGGGHIHFLSYGSSFSSASGNLSAQFGVHYANFLDVDQYSVQHGLSGSAAVLYSAPLLDRYANGIPELAFGFYFGVAPVIAIRGDRYSAWVPAAIGLALPYSPTDFLSLSPWFEVAVGLSAEARVDLSSTAADSGDDFSDVVDLVTRFGVTGRGGLTVTFHIAELFDVNLTGTVFHLGNHFGGPIGGAVGAQILFHWDQTVPAVLPPARRVEGIDCETLGQLRASCMGSVEPDLEGEPTDADAPANETAREEPQQEPQVLDEPAVEEVSPEGPGEVDEERPEERPEE